MLPSCAARSPLPFPALLSAVVVEDRENELLARNCRNKPFDQPPDANAANAGACGEVMRFVAFRIKADRDHARRFQGITSITASMKACATGATMALPYPRNRPTREATP